jgi:hypothetical protein
VWQKAGVPAEEPALRGHSSRSEVSHAWAQPVCVVAVAVAAATALAAAAPAGRAGNPQVNHFDFAFDFTWNDFCGTGADVQVSGDYHGTEFLDPNQPVVERVHLEGEPR